MANLTIPERRFMADFNYDVAKVVNDAKAGKYGASSSRACPPGRSPSQHDQPLEPLVDLHRSGLATVLVDTLGLRSELPAVGAGNRAGGTAAGRRPAGLGHRRAGSVLGPTELMTRDSTSQISETG